MSYLELERRNDRWVTEDMIKIDEEKVDKELNNLNEEKIKREEEQQKTRFLLNDVHQGMS